MVHCNLYVTKPHVIVLFVLLSYGLLTAMVIDGHR